MDNQILLNIKDSSKLAFFLEVIKNFDFVSVKQIVTNNEAEGNKEILENIKKGLEELKQIEKGELKTRPAKEFIDEL